MTDPHPPLAPRGVLRVQPLARPLLLPRSIYLQMIAHCIDQAPLEACGILGGLGERAVAIHPLRNELASPTRYQAQAVDLLAAFRSLEQAQLQLLAIYHSHPQSQPIPSRVDLDQNYYEFVPRIIVSLMEAEPVVRVWRLDPDSYTELEWSIVAD